MSAFFEFMSSLPAPFNMVVAVVAIGCGAGVITTVTTQIRIYFDHEADRALKRDLVESGVDPAEAQRLVQTKVARSRDQAAC